MLMIDHIIKLTKKIWILEVGGILFIALLMESQSIESDSIKYVQLGRRHSTEVAFALLTQQPRGSNLGIAELIDGT